MTHSSLFSDQGYLSPQVLEVVPNAIIVTDLEQQIRYINSAACQILGVDRDTTLAVHLKDLLGGNGVMTPQQAETYHQALANILQIHAPAEDFKIPSVRPYEQTWSPEVANGKRLKCHSAAIWSESPEEILGIVVTIEDVTTEYKADEVLNSLFNEMMTPLSSIKGFSAVLLLESDGLLNDEQRQMVKIINEKASYLLHLRKEAYDAMVQQRK
jgi:PAS domain S-box-containing protein